MYITMTDKQRSYIDLKKKNEWVSFTQVNKTFIRDPNVISNHFGISKTFAGKQPEGSRARSNYSDQHSQNHLLKQWLNLDKHREDAVKPS